MTVVYGIAEQKEPETVVTFSQTGKNCASKKCPGKCPSTMFSIDLLLWHLDCYIKEKNDEYLNR